MTKSFITRCLHQTQLAYQLDGQSMEQSNAYTILVGNTERKRSLGRFRRRWKNNIKIRWDGVAQSRDQRYALVNTTMDLRVP
jgi:hypothetical protein